MSTLIRALWSRSTIFRIVCWNMLVAAAAGPAIVIMAMFLSGEALGLFLRLGIGGMAFLGTGAALLIGVVTPQSRPTS